MVHLWFNGPCGLFIQYNAAFQAVCMKTGKHLLSVSRDSISRSKWKIFNLVNSYNKKLNVLIF